MLQLKAQKKVCIVATRGNHEECKQRRSELNSEENS